MTDRSGNRHNQSQAVRTTTTGRRPRGNGGNGETTPSASSADFVRSGYGAGHLAGAYTETEDDSDTGRRVRRTLAGRSLRRSDADPPEGSDTTGTGAGEPDEAEKAAGQPDGSDSSTTTGLAGRFRRPSRRTVMVGLAGGSVGVAAAWYAAKTLTQPDPAPPARAASGIRTVDAGGFANADQSFARSAGALPVDPNAGRLFPTASEAAAGTPVTVPTILTTDDPVRHLVRRATYGATPGQVDEIHATGIDAWLAQQLDPEAGTSPEAQMAWGLFPRASMTAQELRESIEPYAHEPMWDYGKASMGQQIWSPRQLYEIMVEFWANHLNVPMPNGSAWDVGISYHNDVIRGNAVGSFTDMLLAAMRHPAMMRYLSNYQSTKTSVNENLGRELLELHTVGVGSGYTEDDVRNSAYILTGRTVVPNEGPGEPNSFTYDQNKHWTGAVQVLDFQHPNDSASGGLEVGDAYLQHLAAHPATAVTIARKLAVRFVSDDPPASLVDRLARAYTDSGTAIIPVLDIMFRSSEFWAAVGQKTRRPLENTVATIRALDIPPTDQTLEMLGNTYWTLQKMGHQPLAWLAPNGYPDVRAAWPSTSGLLETWNMHRRMVQGWDRFTPPAPEALVAGLPQGTVGEYVDSLCGRLCHQTFLPHHRDALLAFVQADPATPTGQTDLQELVKHVVPLVFDSPYFALR